MKKIKTLSLTVSALLATSSLCTLAYETSEINIESHTKTGKPTFVSGDLGLTTAKTTVNDIKSFLANQPDFQIGNEIDFIEKRQWTDTLGKTHTALIQTINGLPVVGTSLIVHSENRPALFNVSTTKTQIYAMSGTVAPLANSVADKAGIKAANMSAEETLKIASDLGELTAKPKLVYIYLPFTEETKLAWQIALKYQTKNGFEQDDVFFDVSTSKELTRHSKVYRAKSHQTYDYNYAEPTRWQPNGTLLCTNNQNCSDDSAQRAHDGASAAYDYYAQIHNRDSIDNSGVTIKSNVHVGPVGDGGAFWWNNNMYYLDGDGNRYSDATLSYDVIAHELTHGITEKTAGLIYQNASGALNEAFSDILSVSADAHRRGTTQPDWDLAEDFYTPNISGDALRYMDDPTKDRNGASQFYSRDWWPDRFPYSANPDPSTNDLGGVHLNSGIANLAYSLLVDGGTHPRNKSTAQVPGIGLLKAEKIFYRALATYLTPNSDFAAARAATSTSAAELFGESEKNAVETAWCAVGVGTCPKVSVPLANGVPINNISGTEKQQLFYTLDVPAGVSDLNFVTTGGTGDADLYVKYASQPSLTSFECKSTTATSNERCDITNIQAGTYHVMVEAWNEIKGISLTASFQDSEVINVNFGDFIYMDQGKWVYYSQEIPAGYSSIQIDTSRGSSLNGDGGDVDLYIRRDQAPTKSSYDCISAKANNDETCIINNPQAGKWYIGLYGYKQTQNISLKLKATP